jgi:hypothetical protein
MLQKVDTDEKSKELQKEDVELAKQSQDEDLQDEDTELEKEDIVVAELVHNGAEKLGKCAILCNRNFS